MGVARNEWEFELAALIGLHVPSQQGVIDHAQGRVALKGFCDTGELVREKEIVDGGQGYDLASGLRDTKVERRGLAGVGLSQKADARLEPMDDLGRAVG